MGSSLKLECLSANCSHSKCWILKGVKEDSLGGKSFKEAQSVKTNYTILLRRFTMNDRQMDPFASHVGGYFKIFDYSLQTKEWKLNRVNRFTVRVSLEEIEEINW